MLTTLIDYEAAGRRLISNPSPDFDQRFASMINANIATMLMTRGCKLDVRIHVATCVCVCVVRNDPPSNSVNFL